MHRRQFRLACRCMGKRIYLVSNQDFIEPEGYDILLFPAFFTNCNMMPKIAHKPTINHSYADIPDGIPGMYSKSIMKVIISAVTATNRTFFILYGL